MGIYSTIQIPISDAIYDTFYQLIQVVDGNCFARIANWTDSRIKIDHFIMLEGRQQRIRTREVHCQKRLQQISVRVISVWVNSPFGRWVKTQCERT